MSPAPANDAPAAGVAALTRRLAAGDETAFREFHARYFDRLYHFLLVVTRGQEHAAQDALQETLLRVVRHAREFEHEDVFWSWLKAIARNAARDGSRRERRYFAVLERFARRSPAPASADDHGRDEELLHSLLREVLAEIPDDDRRLVEGKYLRGVTVAELAASEDLSEKTVESRLARLRRHVGAAFLKKLRRA